MNPRARAQLGIPVVGADTPTSSFHRAPVNSAARLSIAVSRLMYAARHTCRVASRRPLHRRVCPLDSPAHPASSPDCWDAQSEAVLKVGSPRTHPSRPPGGTAARSRGARSAAATWSLCCYEDCCFRGAMPPPGYPWRAAPLRSGRHPRMPAGRHRCRMGAPRIPRRQRRAATNRA
jgi:hypothetical protein